jgi:hypothetical protein
MEGQLMRIAHTFNSSGILSSLVGLSLGVAAVLEVCVAASAQTLVYSFEETLEGFTNNGGGTQVTPDTIGVTDGMASMKVTVSSGATFVGAVTDMLHPAIENPGSLGTGIDHVLFDLTITEEFAPPPPDARFAVVGVTIFAQTEDGSMTGIPVQFRNEYHIDRRPAGTYPVRIDLLDAHPYGPDFLVDNASFNEVFGDVDNLIPTGFQLFFNKTGSLMDHPLTVYIDNIRVGFTPPPMPGDFNGDGNVDAADYVVWRMNLNTNNELPNDNDLGVPITTAHYDLWRQSYGGTPPPGSGSLSAVPEPGGHVSLIIVGVCSWVRRPRGIAGR